MALEKCKECGLNVSSEAANCPHCGIQRRATPIAVGKPGFNIGLGSFVLIGLLLFWLLGSFDSKDTPVSSGSEVRASLLSKQPECIRNVAELETLGTTTLVDRGDFTVMQVDDYVWSQFSHDDKVRQGLLVYCAKMPASGKYSVLIKGRKSGNNLGGIVDGNWTY